MDSVRYIQKQDKWTAEFEALCLRCGKCCGADNDPCARLSQTSDGRFACSSYGSRLGKQLTVSGRIFTCVPIGEVIAMGVPDASCGYAKGPRR